MGSWNSILRDHYGKPPPIIAYWKAEKYHQKLDIRKKFLFLEISTQKFFWPVSNTRTPSIPNLGQKISRLVLQIKPNFWPILVGTYGMSAKYATKLFPVRTLSESMERNKNHVISWKNIRTRRPKLMNLVHHLKRKINERKLSKKEISVKYLIAEFISQIHTWRHL